MRQGLLWFLVQNPPPASEKETGNKTKRESSNDVFRNVSEKCGYLPPLYFPITGFRKTTFCKVLERKKEKEQKLIKN
jgi:hypothetical protein